MGSSLYNASMRSARATSDGFHTKSVNEIFKQSQIHESMNPMNLQKRECFDSPTHPNSLPIIIGLDVTGSMGRIPHSLVKDGLPTMMTTLISTGLPDAAVCFVAVGDHKSDSAPLQVGQFESGDKELDDCLTNTWLESNGGGNGGESYFLPWLFAGRHTKTHAWEKRNEKGFLFTIGDERCHSELPKESLKRITGGSEEVSLKAVDLLAEAQKTYNVYHLYLETGHDCFSEWKERLGNNAIKVDDYHKIPEIIAGIILGKQGKAQPAEVSSAFAADTDTETIL